jgi:hypothetical protein
LLNAKKTLPISRKVPPTRCYKPRKSYDAYELGLPPRFEQAMHRRPGHLGIFVEVNNGRHYLSEERLKQLQEQRQSGGGRKWRQEPNENNDDLENCAFNHDVSGGGSFVCEHFCPELGNQGGLSGIHRCLAGANGCFYLLFTQGKTKV